MPYQINMFGSIGMGYDPFSGTESLSPTWLSEELDKAGGDDVTMLWSSDGGSVFDGLAMAELITNYQGKTESQVVSLAASIASVMAIAADEVTIAPGAFMMVHYPYSGVMGDAAALRKTADLLDKITDNTLVPRYVERSNLSREQVIDMLAAETWISSDEAVELGFADSLSREPATKVAALLREPFARNAPLGVCALTPAEYRASLDSQLHAVQAHAITTPHKEMLNRIKEQHARNMERIEAI